MADHPIADDILAAYAAGNLAEAFDLVVASHVALSDGSRGRLRELERLGGAMLDREAGAALADNSLAATMARIAAMEKDPPRPLAPPPPCPVLPLPVRAYTGGTLADIRWRPLGMGVKQAILKSGRDASARLLFIPAGTEMPDHGHRGMEMTLVLQGAVLDGDERYARGDVEVADETLMHRPVADIGEDCVCLVACEGPLRFSGLLPRIAQPFLRI